ncbi:MAG: EAL domain-containing protein, partial [Ramlibacter sp.]|nr:EAL domain-containing protein [Ramlibacter sp.]
STWARSAATSALTPCALRRIPRPPTSMPSMPPWCPKAAGTSASAMRQPMPLTTLIPLDERERLVELHDFGILDTEPDDDYDWLVQLATVLCGTPMGTYFGTGYSSLAYIVTLPIDEVKIDRAFVKKITADPAYKDIVNTCIALAHNLNLKVVAEGVEIQGQATVLRQLGCDQAQGFLYSPPVPADQLARMLRQPAGPT